MKSKTKELKKKQGHEDKEKGKLEKLKHNKNKN